MDYTKLSKNISYILRHNPAKYNLKLDEEGFVSQKLLLNALKNNANWQNISVKDIEYVVKNNDKGRFEVVNDKIRALYGHSITEKIIKVAVKPPDVLYHGTAKEAYHKIMTEGIRVMRRQYVHLSEEIDTAYDVGKRRDKSPIILEIDAKFAWNEGIKFYQGNKLVWLADFIDIKYIKGPIKNV